VEKAAYAGQSSTAVADAAFAAARGAVVGPVRGPLGWHVVRIEAVEQVAGKSLAQARDELAAELSQRKTLEAMADLHDKVDDGITDNATFDELVADAKLEAVKSPPLFAGGRDPARPGEQPDPVLAQVANAGFAAEPGDEPQIVQLGQDGSFAVVVLDAVQQAAPPPLAQIREAVVRDYMVDEAVKASRAAAAAILANVNRGSTLQQAMAASGLRLPAPQPIDTSRAELARAGRDLPPPVTLMFSMAEKKAKLIEAPNRGGWFVVYLDRIQRGDASNMPQVINSTRAGLGSVVGREYAEQFAEAVRRDVGVRRNQAAIAKLRSEFGGQGGAEP
jgi:peptidyl-prolyl cis-trans isomerase D